MKKIFLIITASLILFTALPISSAFAYSGGLTHLKPYSYNEDGSKTINDSVTTITDNNLTNGQVLQPGKRFFHTFKNPVTITHYQLKATGGTYKIYAEKTDGTIVIMSGSGNTSGNKTGASGSPSNVKNIFIENYATTEGTVNEFDVFGYEDPLYPDLLAGKLMEKIAYPSFTPVFKVDSYNTKDVTDNNHLTYYNLYRSGLSTSFDNAVYYQFSAPINVKSIGFKAQLSTQWKIYLMDSEKNIISTINGSDWAGDTYANRVFNAENVSYVVAHNSNTSNNASIHTLEIHGTKNKMYDPVQGLKETHTHNQSILSWLNPTDTEFSGTIVKKNGVEVANLSKDKNTYSAEDLEPEKSYNFEVIAKYSDGVDSVGKTITVVTDPPPPPGEAGEIINLTAEAESQRVDLSWKLPESDIFKHVNIYRDTVVETSLLDKILGTRIAYAAETKIFETNGTYFNDLTVEPETTYEYTLTTTSTEGAESDGVTTQVTTPEIPPPVIVGGGFETDPLTGNYIYYWDEPTEGTVKVLLGGSVYKTVDSAAKKISIPKNEMKYTAFGDPDVTLIPVASDGEEGAAVKPPLNGEGSADSIENVKVPFSASDLLTSGTGLLWFVAPIVLLALAFLLVPKLRGLVFAAFTKKNGKEAQERRFTSPDPKETREEREKREKTEREEREKREARERGRVKAERKAETRDNVKENVSLKAARAPRIGREKAERRVRTERTKRERSTRERAPRAGRG